MKNLIRIYDKQVLQNYIRTWRLAISLPKYSMATSTQESSDTPLSLGESSSLGPGLPAQSDKQRSPGGSDHSLSTSERSDTSSTSSSTRYRRKRSRRRSPTPYRYKRGSCLPLDRPAYYIPPIPPQDYYTLPSGKRVLFEQDRAFDHSTKLSHTRDSETFIRWW